MEVKTKRTAREINVNNELINNKNISVKIGTVENREAPETIYIFISFWAKPVEVLLNKTQDFLKDLINTRLDNLYKDKIKNKIISNKYFINEKDNIFIKNIPENINYNSKRNFISIELYLHTANINQQNKFSLSNKKDTKLFDETLKLVNIIGDSPILSSGNEFKVFRKSM
jgi:hypothetical protein